MKPTSRDDVIRGLVTLLDGVTGVCAVWEGGSTATGWQDDFSDIDLTIVTDGISSDSIFEYLDLYIEKTYGIESKFRVPEPTWHKMSQCFYFLKNIQAMVYADIAVVSKDHEDKFTQPDRHGRAKVYFDKVGIYCDASSSDKQIQELCSKVYHSTTAIDFLLFRELEKALLRDNKLAVITNFIGVVNRCLVPLMNIKHRPAKADFGIRYSDREYPSDDAQYISNLLYCSDAQSIRKSLPELQKRYSDLKTELSKRFDLEVSNQYI